ncbi:hypothetical protein K5I29_09525 [Flavobacterium agricola]|uniref:Uncharacterized protein n=1 Tax=Flavobacterium agricola TaxID=2870839 RepID=A0ABY6LWQ0_9FLAO|nr:hypothetical protein [Flavobacterium agricola]UYW00755.1 hypothetical protein K5I29_09525 [Flavobacterium agricola]
MFTKLKNIVLVLLLFVVSVPASAQCAMCRAVLESDGNSVTAEAVNDGIVYLMVIPYILVAVVGIVVYRIMNGNKKEDKNKKEVV